MNKNQLVTCSMLVVLLSSVSAAYSMNHYKITVSSMSLNSDLSHMKDLDMGYKVELQYLFNSHLYVKVNSTGYGHDKFGFGGRVGVQTLIKKFKPYAEIGVDNKPHPQGSKTQFAYDVGLGYNLATHFQPFVEVDNFTYKDRASAKVGANIPLNSKFTLAGDYIHNLETSGDGFEVKLSYAF